MICNEHKKYAFVIKLENNQNVELLRGLYSIHK